MKVTIVRSSEPKQGNYPKFPQRVSTTYSNGKLTALRFNNNEAITIHKQVVAFSDILAIASVPDRVAQFYAEDAAFARPDRAVGDAIQDDETGPFGCLFGILLGGLSGAVAEMIARKQPTSGCVAVYQNADGESVSIFLCGRPEYISQILATVPANRHTDTVPPPFDQLDPTLPPSSASNRG